MKTIVSFLALSLCLTSQLYAFRIGGQTFGRPVYREESYGEAPDAHNPTPEDKERFQKKIEGLKNTALGIKELGKVVFGGGGKKILQNVINNHAAFCRKMGAIFKESNSPMDTTNIKIPRVWIYYYINNTNLGRDDLCHIYIKAYEELERLINEDEELKPYLEKERYTREDDRLILGFKCVDENYVMQEMPNLSFIYRDKNDQIQLSYNKYGVIYGVSGCVIESEKEEIGGYHEIKRRLGL